MCATAGLQVNLDFDARSHSPDTRWGTAHVLGPVLAASFANSPLVMGVPSGWKSYRLANWWRLDRVPHQIPRRRRARAGRRGSSYVMDAQVMLIRTDEGGCVPVRTPLTFRQWVTDGHPLGFPTLDDLDYHVTTLFPPIRPRGWLELRMVDSLPQPWWRVPVAVAAALVYDAEAGEAAAQAAWDTVRPVGGGLPLGPGPPRPGRRRPGLLPDRPGGPGRAWVRARRPSTPSPGTSTATSTGAAARPTRSLDHWRRTGALFLPGDLSWAAVPAGRRPAVTPPRRGLRAGRRGLGAAWSWSSLGLARGLPRRRGAWPPSRARPPSCGWAPSCSSWSPCRWCCAGSWHDAAGAQPGHGRPVRRPRCGSWSCPTSPTRRWWSPCPGKSPATVRRPTAAADPGRPRRRSPPRPGRDHPAGGSRPAQPGAAAPASTTGRRGRRPSTAWATGPTSSAWRTSTSRTGPTTSSTWCRAPTGSRPGGGFDLGALKGNKGSQNYPIPADVDVHRRPVHRARVVPGLRGAGRQRHPAPGLKDGLRPPHPPPVMPGGGRAGLRLPGGRADARPAGPRRRAPPACARTAPPTWSRCGPWCGPSARSPRPHSTRPTGPDFSASIGAGQSPENDQITIRTALAWVRSGGANPECRRSVSRCSEDDPTTTTGGTRLSTTHDRIRPR